VAFTYSDGQQIGEVAANHPDNRRPMPGVNVLNSSGGRFLWLSPDRTAAGRVTVTAFDPTSTVFNAWHGSKASAFLAHRPDRRRHSAFVDSRLCRRSRRGRSELWILRKRTPQLKSALIRAPFVRPPRRSARSLSTLVIYIVVLVPLKLPDPPSAWIDASGHGV